MSYPRRSSEAIIVRRRLAENKLATLQKSVNTNFHLGSVAQWQKSSLKLSENKNAQRERQQTDIRNDQELHVRRLKLKQLLLAEEEEYKREIESKVETQQQRYSRLEKRAKELRQRRIDSRKGFVAEQRKKQFREQCDELRRNHGRNLTKHCDEIRKKQMNERAIESKYQQIEDAKWMNVWQTQLNQKIEREARESQSKQALNDSTAVEIRAQMARNQLKKASEQQQKSEDIVERLRLLSLHNQEDRQTLHEKQALLNQLKSERVQEFKEFQLKKENELKTAKQIDREFIQAVLKKEKEDIQREASKKDGESADISSYLEYLASVRKKSKEQEQELDVMREVELEKEWQKREKKWANEELARKQLLKNVIAERHNQIQYKIKMDDKLNKYSAAEAELMQKDISKYETEEAHKLESKLKYNRKIQNFLNGQINEKKVAVEENHEQKDYDDYLRAQQQEYKEQVQQHMTEDEQQMKSGKVIHAYPRKSANWWTY